MPVGLHARVRREQPVGWRLMEAVLFIVIMATALAVAGVVIGRAQRHPSPDNPTRPEPGEHTTDASDSRDRPAGAGAEVDTPHPSQLQPGEARDPGADGEGVTRPSGRIGNEPEERAP